MAKHYWLITIDDELVSRTGEIHWLSPTELSEVNYWHCVGDSTSGPAVKIDGPLQKRGLFSVSNDAD